MLFNRENSMMVEDEDCLDQSIMVKGTGLSQQNYLNRLDSSVYLNESPEYKYLETTVRR